MSRYYNLVDRTDSQYLGSFITSLTPKRIHELEIKAEKASEGQHPDTKSEILYDLIKDEDLDFYKIPGVELEI